MDPLLADQEVTNADDLVEPTRSDLRLGDDFTEESQDAFQRLISVFNTFLLVFALIALFVGSFIIYNTFSIIVAQRTRELALLRAVGAGTASIPESRSPGQRRWPPSSTQLVKQHRTDIPE